MKRVWMRTIAAVMVLALALVGTAGAVAIAGSNFVGSVEQKAAPTLSKMTSADGTECYGIVYNADGTEAYVITDASELVVTAYAARITATEDIRTNLESAYKDVAAAENLGALTEELVAAVKKLSIDVGIEDLVVSDLFDVTAYGSLKDELYKEGAYLVVVLETATTLDKDTTFVLHDAFYDGLGQWDLRPSTVLDEHHVQVTFNGLSPVALVVPEKDVEVDPDGPKSPDTGVGEGFLWVTVAAAVVIGGGLVFARKRHA